jgi:hypothetical protein
VWWGVELKQIASEQSTTRRSQAVDLPILKNSEL